MIRRSELAGIIADLSGPLGPFVTPSEREAEINQFLNTIRDADVPDLIDALFSTVRYSEPTDMWADQRALLAQEAIVAAAATPDVVLSAMVDALDDRIIRGAAVDVIGALGLAEGVPAVLTLLDAEPTDDELVRVAAALGEIGGEEANAGLSRINRLRHQSTAIYGEVEAALEAIAQRNAVD